MKILKTAALIAGLLGVGFISFADSPLIQTIEEYNQVLPVWGASWLEGAKSVNGYYPTFYTGFVMRSEFPERIHIRTSRGNQTRVSVILDDQTITDYTFDLAARYNFYKKVTAPASKPQLDLHPSGASFLPQMTFFNQILESPNYGILDFVKSANQGQQTAEQIYAKNLNTLRALNPGRVFMLNIDLNREFNNWKAWVQENAAGNAAKITANSQLTVTAIDTLVFGRINYTAKPSADVLAKLTTALNAAIQNVPQVQMTAAALDLFKAVTGTKYDFKVVNNQGQWQQALQCSSASCTLSYPEFTAIYPTGSVIDTTTDEFGNRIGSFATVGLWQFLNYSGRDVDNIRNEPYYGFIPKMDFQGIGNGFHNPAIRFWDPSKATKVALGLPLNHDTFWAAKRGGVSHGCLRLPSGSIWELRHIFPVENAKMTQIRFFASRPQDFDLFDIDGSGQLKVMGVQYYISYDLSGTSDTAQREGANLQINGDKKLAFYSNLYGANNVFTTNSSGDIVFNNPHISLPSYLDDHRDGVNTKFTVQGQYPLYEQTYQQDRIQFYALSSNMDDTNKMIARLMGRVRGCAPTSDKNQCGQAAFETEAQQRVH